MHEIKDLAKIDFPTFKLYPTVEDFSLLGRLRSLRILECVDCDAIHDTHIAFVVDQLKNLVSLSLKNCENVTGTMFNQLLKSAEKLVSLNLSGTGLTDAALVATKWEQSNIEEIDLSYCIRLTDEGLSNSLYRMKKLHYLSLNNVNKGLAVNETVFEKSSEAWSDLITLSVSVSRVHRNALRFLKHCNKLQHISFRTCPSITFTDIAHSVQYFPDMIYIY